MEELGKSIEKIVKAGIGAVSEGLNRTQEVVDKLAVKGEPLYNQARDTVTDTAEKICQAVKKTMESDSPLDDIKHALSQLGKDQLEEIKTFLNDLAKAQEEEADTECGEEPSPCDPDGQSCPCSGDEKDPDAPCADPASEDKDGDGCCG